MIACQHVCIACTQESGFFEPERFTFEVGEAKFPSRGRLPRNSQPLVLQKNLFQMKLLVRYSNSGKGGLKKGLVSHIKVHFCHFFMLSILSGYGPLPLAFASLRLKKKKKIIIA